ncbi:hypothetical protein KAT80_02425 [Candidatus Pacearchaeota archaeon]|nr:hypothetical protein [Candidatus Pacearchaeota archaeon]
MRYKFGLFLALVFLIGIVSAIPQTFNVNGKLTDSSGTALSGTYNMTFRIYESYTGGSSLWNNINTSVTSDSNGIYHVILSGVNVSESVQYYLGVEVGTDGEMSPRINLTTSPYAFRANMTDYLNASNNYEMGNLTLGEKITFAFGEIIDNLVNGWVRITGGLNVTQNLSVDVNTLFVDSNNNRVGIGTTSPNATLHVAGDINVTSGNDICISGGNCLSSASSDAATLDGYDSLFFMPLNNSVYGQFDFNGEWTAGGLSIIDGDIYAQTGWFYNITGLEVSTLRINGSLLPQDSFDNQFDIGNESLRWRDLYLGGEVFSNGTGDNYFLGKVGIGTDSPGGLLHISAGTSGNAELIIGADTDDNNEDDNPFITFKQDGGKAKGFIGLEGSAGARSTGTLGNAVLLGSEYTSSPNAVQFITNDIVRMTILSNGNVGIGTTTPVGKLNVHDGSFNVSNSGNASLFLVDNVSGNVGIGTTGPGAKLEIKSDAYEDFIILDRTGNESVDQKIYITPSYAPAGNTQLRFNIGTESTIMTLGEDGNVGIGTTSPNATLEVYGGNFTLMNSTGTELNYIKFGRGGYMYDNGTALILGHS